MGVESGDEELQLAVSPEGNLTVVRGGGSARQPVDFDSRAPASRHSDASDVTEAASLTPDQEVQEVLPLDPLEGEAQVPPSRASGKAKDLDRVTSQPGLIDLEVEAGPEGRFGGRMLGAHEAATATELDREGPFRSP